MAEVETRVHLLNSTLRIIAQRGLHGVTMRAVADQADCALGLLNYHFDDKDALIVEAYETIAARLMSEATTDVEAAGSADQQVEAHLLVVFKPEFLTADYLSLRLSLWAAVASDPQIGDLNRKLDLDYWGRLVELIQVARPGLTREQAEQRATDVVIAQNGIWLTWIVRPDDAALERCIANCRRVALD